MYYSFRNLSYSIAILYLKYCLFEASINSIGHPICETHVILYTVRREASLYKIVSEQLTGD